MFSAKYLFLIVTAFSLWNIVVYADQVPLSPPGGGDNPPLKCFTIESLDEGPGDAYDQGLQLGTNTNAWDDESAISTSDCTPLDLDLAPTRSQRLNFHSQPALKNTANCVFQYQHRLGANGTRRYGNLRGDDGIVYASDVHQGGLGDCGIGAAILALIARRQGAALRAVLTVNKDLTLTAYFKRPGVKTPDKVNMDDRLPVRKGGANSITPQNPCSHNFGGTITSLLFEIPVRMSSTIGYIPTLSSTDACDNYRHQVPFLEKALAKFLDAFPAYSSRPQQVGYAGLEGIQPANVMALITGAKPFIVGRKKATDDVDLKNLLKRCIAEPHLACTVTTPVLPLKGIGTRDPKTGLFRLGSSKATLKPLKTTHSFEVTDAQRHRYVIGAWHDYGVVGGNPQTQTVLIANPWGCNPDRDSSNSCGVDKEGNKLPATLSIPLDVLAAFITAINWVALSH
ncbi:hypothetical protein B0H12DRAFT_1237063 [Mycena haematopus]|nr:hypothetical protein B0H12DRAFT_1237063 [Mycena haematopus]